MIRSHVLQPGGSADVLLGRDDWKAARHVELDGGSGMVVVVAS